MYEIISLHGPHGPHDHGSHWSGWEAGASGASWPELFFALLLVLAIAILVIGALYWLTTSATERRSDPAMEQLRSRYARGEITDDEFESRASRLYSRSTKSPDTPPVFQ